jgi:hypothetical protein
MIEDLLRAMEAFGKASGVARSASVYAAVSATHIVGIGLLIGSIAAIDLRLMGRVRALGADAIGVLRRFSRAGVGLAVATGLLLATARPFEYAANPFMLAKLTALAAAVANALAFDIWARRRGLAMALDGAGARLFGLASLALWLLVIWLGRMIAFA